MMEIEIPTKTYRVPSPRQVKAIRSYLGINQVDFAAKASTSPSTVTDYELSRREVSRATMQALALCVYSLGIEFNESGAIILPE